MSQPSIPPSTVTRALWLLWIALGISSVSGLLNLIDPPISELPLAMVRLIGVATVIVVLALEILLLVMMRRARNWARIVYLVLFLLGLPFWISGLIGSSWSGLAAFVILLSIPLTLMRALALWWLFSGAGSVWFQRRLATPPTASSEAAAATPATPGATTFPAPTAIASTPPVAPPLPARATAASASVSSPIPAPAISSEALPGQSVLEAFAAGRELGLGATVASPAAMPTTAALATPSATPAVAHAPQASTTPPAATTSPAGAASQPTPLAELRQRLEAAANSVRIWTTLFFIAAGIDVLLILVFVNKVRQTSEWAMRYSQTTQEQMGEMTIMIILIGITAVVFMLVALTSRGTRDAERERYLAGLRRELTSAREAGDVPHQVYCESELRRMGA